MPPIIPLWILIVFFAVLIAVKKSSDADIEKKKRIELERKDAFDWADRQCAERKARERGPSQDHLAERERGDH